MKRTNEFPTQLLKPIREKLTEADVRFILENAMSKDPIPVTLLAKRFNVSRKQINRILNRKSRQDVQVEGYTPPSSRLKFVNRVPAEEASGLTENDVRFILENAMRPDRLTLPQLAKKFKVGKHIIKLVLKRRVWRSVQVEGYMPPMYKNEYLTEVDVRFILENAMTPDRMPVIQLSEKFGVDGSTIRKVLNRESWQFIQVEGYTPPTGRSRYVNRVTTEEATKLTEADVRFILENAMSPDRMPISQLSKRFSVSGFTIRRVLNREIWQSVQVVGYIPPMKKMKVVNTVSPEEASGLTETDVRFILENRMRIDCLTVAQLAAQFKVRKLVITRIIKREIWQSVQVEGYRPLTRAWEKLTEADVRLILENAGRANRVPIAHLAKKLGINACDIRRILSREIWQSVKVEGYTQPTTEEATKLTEVDVRFILENAMTPDRMPVIQLAEKFNVLPKHIYRILNRETWQSVQVEGYTPPTTKMKYVRKVSPEEASGLTETDVRFILENRMRIDCLPLHKLAAQFNVRKEVISRIIKREIWQSVQVEGYQPLTRAWEKLTESDVRFILENAMRPDRVPTAMLAKKLGVSAGDIRRILNREIWENVQVDGYDPFLRRWESLGESEVRFILENRMRPDHMPVDQLAEKFNVSKPIINQILKRNIWQSVHVEGYTPPSAGWYKVTEADVRFILENAMRKTPISVTQLSKRFSIDVYDIGRILNREIWKSVHVEYTDSYNDLKRLRRLSPEEATGLTESDVRFILQNVISKDRITVAKLMAMFQLEKYIIYKIEDREIWQNVEVEGYTPPHRPWPVKSVTAEETIPLTETEARIILENAMRPDRIPVKKLADMFGVSATCISRILNREIWQPVAMEDNSSPFLMDKNTRIETTIEPDKNDEHINTVKQVKSTRKTLPAPIISPIHPSSRNITIKEIYQLTESDVRFIIENTMSATPLPVEQVAARFNISKYGISLILKRKVRKDVEVVGYTPPINKASTLTEADVRFILKNRMCSDPMPVDQLVEKFNVSKPIINRIINREIWQSVQVKGYTPPAKGRKKLDEADVRFILENAMRPDRMTQVQLAEKFNVSRPIITKILKREIWQDVQVEGYTPSPVKERPELTEADVRFILESTICPDRIHVPQLAVQFGQTVKTITKILKREIWQDVQVEGYTPPTKGKKNLTEADVRFILENAMSTTPLSVAQLAHKFNVGRGVIYNVLSRQSYPSVQVEGYTPPVKTWEKLTEADVRFILENAMRPDGFSISIAELARKFDVGKYFIKKIINREIWQSVHVEGYSKNTH